MKLTAIFTITVIIDSFELQSQLSFVRNGQKLSIAVRY